MLKARPTSGRLDLTRQLSGGVNYLPLHRPSTSHAVTRPDRPHYRSCSSVRPSVRLSVSTLSSLLLSSIVSMMLRLLLDASICFCPTPQPLLVVQSTSLLPCLVLHCPSISSVVFLGSFSHWYSSVMLLLAAVRFPFLTHARTNLVFALLFCQPASFPDTPRTVSFNRRKQILL